MSDDLRERIAQAARSAWEGTASTSWEALNEHGRAPWLAQADAVLAVLREDNPPKVCPTCGSDDRSICKYQGGYVPTVPHLRQSCGLSPRPVRGAGSRGQSSQVRELVDVLDEYLIEMEPDNPSRDFMYRQALRHRLRAALAPFTQEPEA